jgi:hypothetical protein
MRTAWGDMKPEGNCAFFFCSLPASYLSKWDLSDGEAK